MVDRVLHRLLADPRAKLLFMTRMTNGQNQVDKVIAPPVWLDQSQKWPHPTTEELAAWQIQGGFGKV